jgi:hypothetical protein
VTDFEKRLISIINSNSLENGSNTPDFILASYLQDCLTAFNKASVWRAKWFSADGVPEAELYTGPSAPFVMGELSRKPAEIDPLCGIDPSLPLERLF